MTKKVSSFFLGKSILALLLFSSHNSFSQFLTQRIKINQSGFYTNAPKAAIITGEISTINWNAPMVYLANAIEALQKDLGYSEKNKFPLEYRNKKRYIS